MKNNVKDENQLDERPYKVDRLSKIPAWLVILLLKYWAAAAAVFFGLIGGLDIHLDFSDKQEATAAEIMSNNIVIVVFLALILALFTNYLIRPVIRNIFNGRNGVYKYNMINIKGFLSFVLSLIYNLVISIILFFVVTFFGSKGWIWNPFGTTNYGIEPFSYGLFYIVVDFIFLFFKDLILYIIERIKYKRQTREGEI